MNTTTMTGIAREAMRRAQAGNWDLADAIELRARRHDPDFDDLLFGIPQGGRLQFIAWGALETDEDDDGEWRGESITAITTLNGDVVWERNGDKPFPHHLVESSTELRLDWAEEVVENYRIELAVSEQTPLEIPEAA